MKSRKWIAALAALLLAAMLAGCGDTGEGDGQQPSDSAGSPQESSTEEGGSAASEESGAGSDAAQESSAAQDSADAMEGHSRYRV